MRFERALLLLLLISFLVPVHIVSSQPSESAWELPPLQWTKDLDSGYVSTKPVVTDELVIVKVGGKSDNFGGSWDEGKAPGLYAFHKLNGTQAWRYEHHDSTTGFETSPIEVIEWEDMVVNGWTSGKVTAHNLDDGSLLWEHQTDKRMWGITGKILVLIGNDTIPETIHVPHETGVTGISFQGETRFSHHFPNDATGYRHGIGITLSGWAGLFDVNNTDWEISVGDETGQLHSWSFLGTNFTTWDIGDHLGEGSWKIRSPPFMVPPTNQGQRVAMGVVAQGTDGSTIAFIDIDESGNDSLRERFEIGRAASIPAHIGTSGMFLVGDLERSHSFCLWQGCDTALQVVEEGSVSGEITILDYNAPSHLIAYALPKNLAEGHWTGHTLSFDGTNLTSTLQWEWHPQKAGWLTAGIGGDARFMAAANDASWLEVRFFSNDEVTGSTPTTIDPSVTGLGATAELLLMSIFFAGFAALAGGTPLGARIGSLAILLVLLFLLPTLNVAWVTSVNNQGEDSYVDKSDFPVEYADSQVVCFEFPDDFWEREPGLSVYLDADGKLLLESDGAEVSRMCVGGLEGHDRVDTLTSYAASVAGYEIDSEQQPLGTFVSDIGSAIGGDGDRWWLYWVDGKHANLAVDLQPINSESLVEWRFL